MLHDDAGSTTWGELGTDFWQLGRRWGTWWPASGRRPSAILSAAYATKQNAERQQAAGAGRGDDPREWPEWCVAADTGGRPRSDIGAPSDIVGRPARKPCHAAEGVGG
jgi:hypothetical protein